MGFKWFKARIRMNRMPSHSSAVAGSYRTSTFDSSDNEFMINNNQPDYDRVEPEPKLSTRPISMPILNNPIAGVANGDDVLEFVSSSNNNETTRTSSIGGLEESEITGENMYKGLGVGEPISFPKQKIIQDLDKNTVKSTPGPVPKMKNGDIRKKKVKAPAPKPKINLRTSSANTSENDTAEFVTVRNKRKISQGSDIDV